MKGSPVRVRASAPEKAPHRRGFLGLSLEPAGQGWQRRWQLAGGVPPRTGLQRGRDYHSRPSGAGIARRVLTSAGGSGRSGLIPVGSRVGGRGWRSGRDALLPRPRNRVGGSQCGRWANGSSRAWRRQRARILELGRQLPSTFTARAATSRIVTAEMPASRPIAAFARSDRGITSVGLKAIEFVSER